MYDSLDRIDKLVERSGVSGVIDLVDEGLDLQEIPEGARLTPLGWIVDAIDYPTFLATIYEKFHKLLNQETFQRGVPSSSILQMVPLGMPIDPKDYTDLVAPAHPKGNLLNSQNFARLCNAIPKPGPYYERSLYNVDDVYNVIVHGANVATQRVFDHNKYLDLLKQVQDVRKASRMDVPSDPQPLASGPVPYDRWQAVSDTIVRGLQNELEGYSLTGRDAVSSLFYKATKVFEATRMVSYIPGAPDWHITYPSPDCWASLEENDAYRTVEMTSEEVRGAHASVSQEILNRFIPAARPAVGAVNHALSPLPEKDFTITFSYCFVQIERPWLESYLFRLEGGWYLSKPFHRGCISSGDIDNPGNSTMTLLPSGFIAVKDLTVSGQLAERSSGFFSRSRDNVRSLGSIGPFSLRTARRSLVGDQFRADGMQIVAWLSEGLPVVPPLDPPP